MEQVKNFFKFLKDKEGKNPPLRYKFIYDHESLTPKDLNIKGSLDLVNTKITSLPNNLKVDGYLDLRDTKIASLPNNLYVGGYLDLEDTRITSIPNNLEVGDSLFLYETPLAEKYTKEEIRKMIEDKGGKVKGTTYL